MVVLVIGAGRTGAQVLKQLKKNARIKILTLDPRQNPYAVEQGIIDKVDFREALTPLTLEHVLRQAQPDMVLLAAATEDLGLGTAAGMDVLVEALRKELADIAALPMIEVSRR
jgi:cation diffusion facilitator CzcD-associated flavoprotein CzcO